MYKTMAVRSTQNSKHRLIYKTFRTMYGITSTMFVYTFGSVFTVKLFLQQEVKFVLRYLYFLHDAHENYI